MTQQDEAKSVSEEEFFTERTILASRISQFRDSIAEVIRKRERLPQPLFWSLFNAELSSLKQQKKQQRDIQRILFNLDV